MVYPRGPVVGDRQGRGPGAGRSKGKGFKASRRGALFQEASEALLRLDAAGFAPFDELGHVEATVGGFAVVDP